MIALCNGGNLQIGRDFVEAATGPFFTKGGAEIDGREYSVFSTLGCSDTSDALIRLCRRDGVRLASHWTQAIERRALA